MLTLNQGGINNTQQQRRVMMICVYDRDNCNKVVALGLTLDSINAAEYLAESSFSDGIGRFGICTINVQLTEWIMDAYNNNEEYFLEDRV